MKGFLTAFLVLIFLFTFCSALWAQSGLMLGFRRDPVLKDSIDRKAMKENPLYRTLWIYPRNDTMTVLQRPDIIVPRENGFWQVGKEGRKKDSWYEEHVYAVPFGTQPSFTFSVDTAGIDGAMYRDILFVSPAYIGIKGTSGGCREASAHSWAYSFFGFERLEALDRPLSIQSMMGGGALKALVNASHQYRKEHPESRGSLAEESRPEDWSIVRGQGCWNSRGFLTYSNEVHRGQHAHFFVPFTPPGKIVSYDRLPLQWKDIAAAVPAAVDACASPGNDMLVVFTARDLLVYRNSTAPDWAAPALTFPREDYETPIMIQWAAGDQVQKWTAGVQKMGFKEAGGCK